MRPEKNHTNDLDYLSDAGYDKFPGAAADLNELQLRFNKKHGRHGRGSLAPGAVSVALLIVSTIAFSVYDTKDVSAVKSNQGPLAESPLSVKERLQDTISLQAITIVPENFTRNNGTVTEPDVTPPNQTAFDTLQVVTLATKAATDTSSEQGTEQNLKFSYNSELNYIHDLKVTEYNRLYFKKQINEFLNGIPAAYAVSIADGPRLKQEASVYLHEQFSEALLAFRKEDYARSIYLFNEVASYNKGDVNCSFYLGMSYYYRKQYADAILSFDRCLESSNNTFTQESEYYKALSLGLSGHEEEAKRLLSKIESANGFYALNARKYLSTGKVTGSD